VTRLRQTLPPMIWAVTLLVLGSLSVAGAWQHWLPVLVLAAAAVLPFVLVRAVHALGVPVGAAAGVLALLLVLVAYLLGADADASWRGTVTDALPRLLTAPRPYAVRSDLLAAPVLLVGLVSLATAVRADDHRRTRPVVAALVLYVAGALLTAGAGDPWGLLAAALLTVAFGGWVLLDEHPEPTRSRLTVAGPTAVLGVAAVAVMALVPSTAAFEPRDHVTPPLVAVDEPSPLPRLSGWAASPDQELLRVTGDPVPLRLATLDTYDGTHWQATTRFAPFGTEPAGLPPGARQRRATAEVTFTGLDGHWLPSPGEPVSLSGDDEALVDPGTGTLYDAVAEPGTTYTVTAVADSPTPQDLLDASVPTGPEVDPYLALPVLPPALQQLATQVTTGSNGVTPYARALAIEEAVRTGRQLSSDSISGSSLWRIEAFLTGRKGTSGALQGTSEQFASAFALLARANGLPARVVVGFRPGAATDAGDRVVRAGDALAWPEIYFARLGWVPFSPQPADDTFTDDRPFVPAPPSGPATPARPDKDADDKSDEAAAAPEPASGPLDVLPWAGALLGLGVVAVAVARQARSTRHRRDGATGAWAEVLDALLLAGIPRPASAPATGIGALADRTLGIQAGARLAARAERAAFGPPPATTTDDATRADLRALRRAARAHLPWWRRWTWHVDPRVLRRAARAR
jgi:transglutaminase-like putative cysteine protease